MIVPMAKAALILPVADRDRALEVLRDLGTLHIRHRDGKPGEDQAKARAEESALISLRERLEGLALPADTDGEAPAAEEMSEAAARAFAEREAAADQLQRLETAITTLRPWGGFDPALLRTLAERGVHVRLCQGSEREYRALKEAGSVCIPLAEDARRTGEPLRFAVVSDQPSTKDEALPVADLPLDRPLSAYEAEAAAARERRDRADAELARLKAAAPRLTALARSKGEEAEFLAAREAMPSQGVIAGISGFVPEEKLPLLAEAARRHGWGLVDAKPDPDEPVPTLLKKPRWGKLIDPMLDFLALSPGYREMDVSVPVLFFLTLFFGILIADAVYGVLFVAIAAVVYLTKGRSNPKLRLAAGLFGLFGLSSLVWGCLTGNYGGYETHGLPYLTEGPDKDNHMKLVCFALGAFHLSIGHLMQMFRNPLPRRILAHTGWIMVLVGNFALVAFLLSLVPGPFPAWLPWNYGIAALLILVGEFNRNDLSSMLSCPLEIMNSFSDILSYIRLFAVCTAGLYLAVVFNDIAFGMMTSVVGAVLGVVLLLLGHVMNLALGGLAILVHGVRLNTLEFSSHAHVRWGGFPFAPFGGKPSA